MPQKCVHQYVHPDGDEQVYCGHDHSMVCNDDEIYGCEDPDEDAGEKSLK